jgi:antitoxin (DNA-binding transcriptional repressor) of toxin-antitoxin stability system
MHEAKTNLSRLVAAVESGEAGEVEIARAGHVVARIVPARSARTPGFWAGRVHMGPISMTCQRRLPPRFMATIGEGPTRHPYLVVVALG